MKKQDRIHGPNHISRRAAVERVAMLMGGALSAPLVSGMLAGCRRQERYVFQTLTTDQNRLVTAIVDGIIPETNTPGAAGARVNEFIDHMLSAWYDAEDGAALLDAFAVVDQRARDSLGDGFVSLTPQQRTDLLDTLDGEMIEELETSHPGDRPSFFRIKEITLAGYYTSEVGMVDERQYSFVPGRFDPCLPVEDLRPNYS